MSATGDPTATSPAPELATLDRRLEAMRRVVELSDGRLDDELVGRCRSIIDSGAQRARFGAEHTVVALAGATGSGKSSLFNALAREQLATTGVRRPTTSTAQAVWFSATDSQASSASAEPLLDWLGVPQRHHRRDDNLAGLVLLDLPDHDSIEAAHRNEVDRLVEVVDVFCWVVDPEKYADAALHDGYLQRFADHADVTLLVVNQADRLDDVGLRECTADVRRLLREDGMPDVRVLTASARTDEGVPELRSELAARVAEHRAHARRVLADLDWSARELAVACGDVVPTCPDGRRADPLVRALATAASADSVADAVGAAHRVRSRQATGWPVTRWMARRVPDPLRRLARPIEGGAMATPSDAPVRATSQPTADAWAHAGVTNALNDLVNDMSVGVIDPWRDRLRTIAHDSRDGLVDQLDRAVATTDLPTDAPRWWGAWNAAQWFTTICALVGAVWLGVIAVVAWLQMPDLPLPHIGSAPVPTVLVVAGLAASLLLAVIGRLAAAVSATRRRAVAHRRLSESVQQVAQTHVIEPLCAETALMGELAEAARAAAPRRGADRPLDTSH